MTALASHNFSTTNFDRVSVLGRAAVAGDDAGIEGGVSAPMFLSRVPCGFPSPTDDHLETRLDIVRRLVQNPASTFFARAESESMVNAGIRPGAILVVDRSLHACHRDIVLAVVNGEFTCKRMLVDGGRLRLAPESPDPRFRSIEPRDGDDVLVWGVVTAAVNEFRRGS